MTLLEHILDGFDLELSFLLIMLIAEFLPLVRNSLLGKRFQISTTHLRLSIYLATRSSGLMAKS